MRTASILLALVVVLGFVREAGAAILSPTYDYSFTVSGQQFGFVQWPPEDFNSFPQQTYFHLGPFGKYNIPFTASQGLIGFCVMVVAFMALLIAILTFRLSIRRKIIRET